MRSLRFQSPSMNGPVPTGWLPAWPGYASITSCARANRVAGSCASHTSSSRSSWALIAPERVRAYQRAAARFTIHASGTIVKGAGVVIPESFLTSPAYLQSVMAANTGGLNVILVRPSDWAGPGTDPRRVAEELDEGVVVAGGRPLADGDLDRWRERVAWASQHPALIPGTVAANVALGRPDAGQAAIEEAARLAGADRFIGDLPDGYATVVGGGGHGLSAGQRQRLGLARALLRDADLLVLDEPTVHLDPAAAAQVAATVDGLRGTRTVLLITHDPDLAARADRVLRLEAGRFAVMAGVR